MSADNWMVCPVCRLKAEEEKSVKLVKLKSAYGKVEPEKYLKMVEEANRDIKLEETLRENYEIGINDRIPEGEENPILSIGYRGRCDVCGFHFSYQKEVPCTTS